MRILLKEFSSKAVYTMIERAQSLTKHEEDSPYTTKQKTLNEALVFLRRVTKHCQSLNI